MRLITTALATGCLAATMAFAATAPGHNQALRSGLVDRSGALGAEDAKLRKTLDKARRALDKSSAAASYSGEIKATGKAAKILEKKASGETSLLDAAESAADTYEEETEALLEALQVAVDGGGLDAKSRKKASRAILKGTAALLKADLADSQAKRLKALLKGWRAALYAEKLDSSGGGSGDLEATWVVDTLQPAESGVGADLDGDGTVDNQLSLLLDLLDDFVPTIADDLVSDLLGESPTVLLIQMWDVRSWTFDPDVDAGVLLGTDTDGNTADNFSGEESFDPGLGVDLEGHAILNGGTSLEVGGRYSVDLGEGLTLPFLDDLGLDLGSQVVLQGTVSEEAHAGAIGFALPSEAVEALVGAFVPEEQQALVGLFLNGIYDIDTDGDGTDDALSAALSFTAVPATLQTSE